MAGRPDRSVERQAIIKSVLQDFHIDAELGAYFAAPDGARQDIRDRIVNYSIILINEHYGAFVDEFGAGKKAFDSGADIASIGTDLAAVLAGGATTKAILAAISGGITASKASIDKNYFYEQSVHVLIKQMEAARREVYSEILEGVALPVDGYPLTAALADLDRYYFAGTFDGAFSAIQANASQQQVQANKDIRQNRIDIVRTNTDAAAAPVRGDILYWLEAKGVRAIATERRQRIARYLQEQFGLSSPAIDWLRPASLTDLRLTMAALAIPERAPDERIADAAAEEAKVDSILRAAEARSTAVRTEAERVGLAAAREALVEEFRAGDALMKAKMEGAIAAVKVALGQGPTAGATGEEWLRAADMDAITNFLTQLKQPFEQLQKWPKPGVPVAAPVAKPEAVP